MFSSYFNSFKLNNTKNFLKFEFYDNQFFKIWINFFEI